ncbi:unnamed protein product [Strongylus vulgaris]|uniref:Uncharacterized protein n=1 Tax=Strongylus vulgaris TaxID=40348 RepID=A0A3P7JZU8_STRVU|nr:unnamed protein product [Strongylus vulgaris]
MYQKAKVQSSASEYGSTTAFSQDTVGTIIQPKEQSEAVEAIRQRYHLIQMAFSTKATKEEQTQLEKILERHQEEEGIKKVLEALRTEQLHFSSFTTRTLTKAVENALEKMPEQEGQEQVVAEAVRTVMSLAIREAVNENAFAMIKSCEKASEATLLMTLASVESLMGNVIAPLEEETHMQTDIECTSIEAVSKTLPEKSKAFWGQNFKAEEEKLTADLGRSAQEGRIEDDR